MSDWALKRLGNSDAEGTQACDETDQRRVAMCLAHFLGIFPIPQYAGSIIALASARPALVSERDSAGSGQEGPSVCRPLSRYAIQLALYRKRGDPKGSSVVIHRRRRWKGHMGDLDK